MTRFVVGDDRSQSTLFPERLDDYLPRIIRSGRSMSLSMSLIWRKLGFDGVEPEATGRPAYHPSTLLKIYVYGYLNRVQSSRRLERECQRNIELVWLTGRLMPDFKTIADFRKDNGDAIRRSAVSSLCCADVESAGKASVAIDGSKFKAVNSRDRQLHARQDGTEAGADRREHCTVSRAARHRRSPDSRGEAPELAARTTRLNEKIADAASGGVKRLND